MTVQEDFMRKNTPFILALLLCSACVYDNNCPDDATRPIGHGDDSGDTGAADALVETEYFFSPDAAMAGETVIISMRSDVSVDFSAIVEVSFLEDIGVCTMTARDDELLMSISIDEAVIPGAVDLVVEMEDGSHAFLEAAFTVLDPNSDEQPQGNDGDSGSGPSSDDPADAGDSDEGSQPSQGSGCD